LATMRTSGGPCSTICSSNSAFTTAGIIMERRLRKLLPDGRFCGVSTKRSRHMASVRGGNNKSTEQKLGMALVRAGIRGWRLRASDIRGRPDFYFSLEKLAIFVDGCFWHGCPRCGHIPKTRGKFWSAKITRNRERDRSVTRKLRRQGLMVLRFWEHELRADLGRCVARIAQAMDHRQSAK